jgi:NAD(P)-dependent dehydrogenase (short-subunit alcohol dehydrogenase family)
MNRLQGKRALVTGGTTGIGLETARQFLAEGARVAITGSSPISVAAAKAELGGDVLGIPADAGHVASQQTVAAAVREAFGGLDVLFVNAGFGDFRPLAELEEAGFDRAIAVNLKGPLFLIQALLPILANPTSIVLNTSINNRIGMPNTAIYAATKAGLASLTRTLSGELVSRGIRVNAVSPGPTATPMHDKLGLVGEHLDALVAQIPAGRRGHPSEIAKAVVFLASDESPFTVGSELVIDGGMTNL